MSPGRKDSRGRRVTGPWVMAQPAQGDTPKVFHAVPPPSRHGLWVVPGPTAVPSHGFSRTGRPALPAHPAWREPAWPRGDKSAPSRKVPSWDGHCPREGTGLLSARRQWREAAGPGAGLGCPRGSVLLPRDGFWLCPARLCHAAGVPAAEPWCPAEPPQLPRCLPRWGLSACGNRRLQLFPVFGSADAGTHQSRFPAPPDPAGFGFTILADTSFSCQ